MKIFAHGRVYIITKPDRQLWSQSNVATTATWPKLPIGLRGRLVDCQQQRVRGTSSDRRGKNYLVTRVSNGRLVIWNRKRFAKRIDPYNPSEPLS